MDRPPLGDDVQVVGASGLPSLLIRQGEGHLTDSRRLRRPTQIREEGGGLQSMEKLSLCGVICQTLPFDLEQADPQA